MISAELPKNEVVVLDSDDKALSDSDEGVESSSTCTN